MPMTTTASGRPLPRVTPLARPLFEAAAEGRFVIPRCPRDGFFYYPRSRCPVCLGDDWSWEEVSGEGRVHAFTVDRVGHDPGQRERLPLVIAAVELAEGPRVTANVIDCDPDRVTVGMPVRVAFEQVDGCTLIQFRAAAD